MAVKRIVPNIATADRAAALRFYGDILDLAITMDHGWIVTLVAPHASLPQLSVAAEGGAGQPVPDLSIEVDNFDEVVARLAAARLALVYGPVTEPWGVRRLFVRDPFGRLINILSHT